MTTFMLSIQREELLKHATPYKVPNIYYTAIKKITSLLFIAFLSYSSLLMFLISVSLASGFLFVSFFLPYTGW